MHGSRLPEAVQRPPLPEVRGAWHGPSLCTNVHNDVIVFLAGVMGGRSSQPLARRAAP
jgi:hypothetical protein